VKASGKTAFDTSRLILVNLPRHLGRCWFDLHLLDKDEVGSSTSLSYFCGPLKWSTFWKSVDWKLHAREISFL